MNLPAVRKPGLLQKNLAPLAQALSRKQTSVPPGTGAGWGPLGAPGIGQLAGDIQTYIDTYGGNNGVTWIYACVKVIMEEMALYPYDFVDPNTASDLSKSTPIPFKKVPKDLRELLKQPNQFMTYFDFMNWKEMDTELTGNSYWLKDQMNLLGQPKQLLRLRPEFTRIAVDKAGNVVGYLYRIQGIDIPFDANEVVHFKLPNPHSEYYGMGTVQGILQDVGMEIGIGQHVVGFFNNGAKISGVLTIAGVLPDDVFDRMKQQFREEYTGASNAYSIMIAEQGMKFDPVQKTPSDSGVVALRDISKDAILAGFGINVEMLGGMPTRVSNNSASSESQVIFSRKMRPRARRNSEKLTYELCGLWGQLGLYIDPTEITEMEVKISRARDMLGAGSTVNESRIEMGLPPYVPENFPGMSDDLYMMANQPILPSGYQPFYTQPQGAHGGTDPFGNVLPGGSNGNANGGTSPTGPAGSPDRVRVRRTMTTSFRALDGKEILSLPSGDVLTLPDGFEELGAVVLKEAQEDDAAALLSIQTTTYREEAPVWQSELVSFFNEQRGRVLRATGLFTDANQARRMTTQGSPRFSKKELDIARIFHEARENDELDSLYRARATGIAQRTVNDIADLFGSAPADVRVVVDDLAKRVVGINKTTRERIAAQIAEGIRRNYSIEQIANGFPDEQYLGIQGVFDAATESRVRTIARTETATVYNLASLSAFNQIGVGRVEVVDGTMDLACREAAGQVWSLAYAAANPISHPNCIRNFVPVFAGTGR